MPNHNQNELVLLDVDQKLRLLAISFTLHRKNSNFDRFSSWNLRNLLCALSHFTEIELCRNPLTQLMQQLGNLILYCYTESNLVGQTDAQPLWQPGTYYSTVDIICRLLVLCKEKNSVCFGRLDPLITVITLSLHYS